MCFGLIHDHKLAVKISLTLFFDLAISGDFAVCMNFFYTTVCLGMITINDFKW